MGSSDSAMSSCTPGDAYACFMRREMDYLVLENLVLAKGEQPA